MKKNCLPSTHHRELVTDWKEDYFTKPEVVAQCADLTIPYIDKLFDNDAATDLVYMDCSAGKNQFAQLLDLPYIAVDLHQYPDAEGEVIKQDWLTTCRHQFKLAPTTEIALGFNPPFGKRYHLLNAFLKHAYQEFEPKFFFLICPEKYKLPKEVQIWYDQRETCILPHFAFYRPSNGELFDFPCDFRVYERRETANQNTRPAPVLTHPLVSVCKVDALEDPDNLPYPNDTVFIRRWGRNAGRSSFEPHEDGSISEYRDCDYLDTYDSWSDRGLSGKMFHCLVFTEPIDRDWFREQFLEEWKKECPRMFIAGNSFNFDLSKGTLCKILHKIL
jgi:hypothetical protein